MKLLKLDIQLFAHHKGQGSTSNGRDSAGRRLGAKAADGEFITGGSIIYRQRGTKVFPGTNVRRGSDDTLYSTIDGIVKFERLGRDKKQASVYPVRSYYSSGWRYWQDRPSGAPSLPQHQHHRAFPGNHLPDYYYPKILVKDSWAQDS